MAAGSVIKTGATTFELTKTTALPNGGEIVRTIPLTLVQARAMRANLERERARIAAQLSALEAKVADADAEIEEAILQGVTE
jgi:Skp family chaperone for outer membrane proteins